VFVGQATKDCFVTVHITEQTDKYYSKSNFDCNYILIKIAFLQDNCCVYTNKLSLDLLWQIVEQCRFQTMILSAYHSGDLT
jgi:hypothetical protein